MWTRSPNTVVVSYAFAARSLRAGTLLRYGGQVKEPCTSRTGRDLRRSDNRTIAPAVSRSAKSTACWPALRKVETAALFVGENSAAGHPKHPDCNCPGKPGPEAPWQVTTPVVAK